MNPRYKFIAYPVDNTRYVPFEFDAPLSGYRLHSWKLDRNGHDLQAIVCWEREPVASQALAQIPHEWLTPLAEFVRRWVTKT